jgi:aspartate racemase
MLGLVGGLGVPAGIYYYRRLVEAFERQKTPLKMLFAHADVHRAVGHVRSGEISHLAEYLAELVESLAGGGATFAAISAVTPHICITQLVERSALPIISILDAVPAELARRRVNRIALLGTRFVIESDLYGALRGFDVVHPDALELEKIDAVYQALALRGSETAEEREMIIRIAGSLYELHRLDAILVAGTDLSPVFESDPAPFPTIDCAQIHIDAIVRAASAES